MKKRFITLGLVCLLMTGCQAAHETIPETTTIAPIDSTHEEIETHNEESAEDVSVAAKDDPEVFTQCIAFDSSFHSPKTDSGAWNPDEEYTDWSWWLARSDGGEWKLMTYGY